jgi:uncharacterized protein involved in exopolysaccharide biosynthesis
MIHDAAGEEMEPRGPQLDLPGVDVGDDLPPAQRVNLRNKVAFAIGALRRRKRLAGSVFLAGVAASCAYLRFRTPTYHVETKILAQKQQSLPSLVRPIDDAPTRSASDLVHRRENLITLIKQTNLFAESGAARPPWYGRLPLLGILASPSKDDDPLNNLVMRLDRALVVTTGEGTITIGIDWPAPQQAYQLVEAALQNFLEARHVQEITAIDEVISLLQARAATLRQQLDAVIAAVQREGGQAADPAVPRATHRAQSEEIVRLRSMLEAKQRAIRDVQEFQRKRLADLKAQLEEKRGIYSDAYPSVISLRQDIEALSHESPQIATLLREEAKLRAEYLARLGREAPPEEGFSSTTAPRAPWRDREESPEQVERLRDARFSYQQMLERINAAQVELDSARAAYKYRYAVIWPAELPKRPASPKPLKVLPLGTLASFLLAVLAATLADRRAARIVERWQVEQTLDLAVLAELRRR